MTTKRIKKVISEQMLFLNKSTYDINTQSLEDIKLAVKIIKDCNGIIYFTGVGKNGHVAQTAASTFASLGIKAVFINPVDAVHGDMGVIGEGDIVFAISKSGRTSELLNFLNNLNESKPKTKIIFLSSNQNIEQEVFYTNCEMLYVPIYKEMIFDIVPTTSILVFSLVLQTIGISVASELNLSLNDFKKNHPGGNIGILLSNKND